MQSQFQHKLAFIAQKKMNTKFIFIVLMIFQSTVVFSQMPKTTWYRYYDHKGIANISTNVTPNHIRFGYEALDQNMHVIQRNHAFNSEVDAKQESQRAAQARQHALDLKLKNAYTNSEVAIQKRQDTLIHIKKQISFQQDQLKQLQNDRIYFKRQEVEYLRKLEAIPNPLKNNLYNNQKNIEIKKGNIDSLQVHYRDAQLQYDQIITRLKRIE